jgi:hypothetical protein
VIYQVLKPVFKITETTGDKGRKRWHMQPLAEVAGFNLTDLLSIHMGRQFLKPLAERDLGEIRWFE